MPTSDNEPEILDNEQDPDCCRMRDILDPPPEPPDDYDVDYDYYMEQQRIAEEEAAIEEEKWKWLTGGPTDEGS